MRSVPPTRHLQRSHIVFFALVTLSLSLCAKASETPQGKTLAMSKNGNYIVVQEWRLGPDNYVEQVTFQVFTKDRDPWQWMTWEGTYWQPDWSVVLTENQGVVKGKGMPINVWPLIPDNGNFIVLLDNMGFYGIWIFRRRTRFDWEAPLQIQSQNGLLVKAIAVEELLPPEKRPKNNIVTWAPPWFEKASFQFSPDDQLLMRYSDSPVSVTINLKDGTIVGAPDSHPAAGR
jgi:hypothetical protein